MLKTININNQELQILYNNKFDNANESDAFLAIYKNQYKVVKIFKNQSVIDNKVKKIRLYRKNWF